MGRTDAVHMTGMSISRTASAARESARLGDGKFGEQHHDEADTVLLDQTPRHEQPVKVRFTWTTYDGVNDDHGAVVRETDVDVRHLLDTVGLDKLPDAGGWFDPTWLEAAAVNSGLVEQGDPHQSLSVGGYVDDGDDISAYVASRKQAGLDGPIGALPDPHAAQQVSEALDAISYHGRWDIDSESQRLIEAYATHPSADTWKAARSVRVERTATLWGALNLRGDTLFPEDVPPVSRVASALASVADEHAGFAVDDDRPTPGPLADGCTCGQCGPGCANALARGCCGACIVTRTAERCSCAKNADGSRTTMLCPAHADSDPCETMALVTGKRRKGTIRSGRCTNCGWQG